ncbi:MAG: hypothetical protein LBJ72_10690, partial [Dysgonamonadaceae bacterium]|nr:hypothetical protein [Dysgonamonadaceae bacterium]
QISQEDYAKNTEYLKGKLSELDTAYSAIKGSIDENSKGTLESGNSHAFETEEIGKLTKQLVKLQIELTSNKDAQKALDKEYNAARLSKQEYINKSAELKNTEKDLSQSIKDTTLQISLNKQEARSAEGSYDNLTAKYSLMKIEINALSEEEGKNSEQKRKLEAEAKVLYERMNELQKATGKAQLQVGDYTMINKELENSLNKVSPAMGRFVTGIKETGEALLKFLATPIGVATAAMGGLIGFIKLYFDAQSSNINIGRDFKAMQDGISEALSVTKTALANLDFTNLHEDLKEAYRIGTQVSLMLGELFELRNSFSLTGKRELAEIEALRTESRDANTPLEERLQMVNDVIERTHKLGEVEKDIQKQEVDANINRLDIHTKLNTVERKFVIDDYIANRKQIINSKNLIEVEAKLSAKREEAKTAAESGLKDLAKSENKEAEAIEKQIAALKNSADYSEIAYGAWKKYSRGSEEVIKGYVDASEKLIGIGIAVERNTRRDNKTRSNIIKQQKQAEKDAEKQAIKNQKEEARRAAENEKVIGNINVFRAKKSAEANKYIANDNKKSFDERRGATRAAADDEIRAVEYAQQAELEAVSERLKGGLIKEEHAANQRILINEKAMHEISKIELGYDKGISVIDMSETELKLKTLRETVAETGEKINEEMQNELTLAAKTYSEQIKLNINSEEAKEQITKDYQQHRLDIIREYNQKVFEFEISQLEELLKNAELTSEKRLAIEKQIANLRKKNTKEIADYEIEQTLRSADEQKSAEEELQKFLNDKRTKATMEAWGRALDLANNYYDAQLSKIDELESREQKYYDEKLKMIDENVEAGLMSEEEADARRRIIEETQLQREKEYERKRKEIQLKQARWEKANSTVQAAINTAVAVTAALPNLILAAIIGAMGAAQIAMIASKEIPSYAKGTDNHPGGIARVGEAGISEMVILPSGKIWKTPAMETYAYLPQGTEILPDFKKAYMELASYPVITHYDDNSGKMAFEFDDVLRKNTEKTNSQLGAINRSIGAMRANSLYSNMKMTNKYRFQQWKK